jgi:hypothetical protein
MKVIAVPDTLHYHEARFAAADKKISSLEEVDVTIDFI